MLAFMALAATGFLWAAIFTGRYFSPSDLLYAYSPWSSVQPAGWTSASVSNPTELDIPLIIEPWLEYGAKRIHSGELPLWNPDNMLGAPFLGNDQSGIFYPVNWLYFLLPSPYMLVVLAWVRLFLAGVGGYLLARQVAGVSPPAAMLAALTIAFGPFMVSWLTWNLSTVVSWLPWLWWATARLFARPSTLWFGVLALIVGLSFLAGHPESSFDMALGTGLFAIFYSAYSSVDERRKTNDEGTKGDSPSTRPSSFVLRPLLRGVALRLTLWVGAYLLGTLLSAAQIFPAIEYILQSQVLAGRTTTGRMPATLDLPYMWTLISPDFFGNPAHHNVWLSGPTYEESNTYSGIGVLLLAPFAFLVKGRRRWLALFLLLVGVLAMGTIYHWPLIYDAVNLFPFVRSTATRRFIMFLPLVLGLLAAMGVDELLKRVAQRHLLLWVGGVLLTLLAIGVAVPWALSHSFFGVPTDSAVANRVWSESLWRALIVLLVTAAVVVGIILVARRWPRYGRFALLILPLVVYLDLWQARWDFNPTVAPQDYFPDTQATSTLQRLPGPARTLGILSLIQNTNLYYGISDIRGYDVIEPRLYRDVAVLVEPAVRDVPGGRVTTFYPESAQSPLLNMLDVRYLLMPPGEDPNYPADVRQDQVSGDTVGEIRGDNRPGQTFVAGADNLAQIQVLGATFGGKATGKLLFHLKYGPGLPADLVTEELDVASLPDNSYWPIKFPPVAQSKGKSFYFYLEAPDAQSGRAATLWYNKNDVYKAGTRTQDGIPVQGDLVFRARTLGYPDNLRYSPVLTGTAPAASIYENKQVLSRAWLAHSAETIPDRESRLGRLSDPAFDPSNTVLLETPLPADKPLPSTGSRSADKVEIKSYRPESVGIATTSDEPALMVLADQYFPGWKATVDGQPVDILPADHALRAVYVPSGNHMVRFTYEPFSFRLGVIASVLALAALVLLWLWEVRSSRRKT